MSEIVLANRYVIKNEIGSGGMAIVYRAYDNILNRDVAIKVLRPEFKQDEEFIKRFDIEAKAAAGLNHINIVGIFDVGVHEGLHYIVMEYVAGKTLKEHIAENGRLSYRASLKIARQISSALSHAHEHKVIHRDIKPHNIMVTADGTVKVMDFGIARATSAATMTIGSKVLGSAHYLSPEQARGGFTDERSDLYSLGVCLYEMVTGRVPFDADTTVAVAMQHLQKDPLPPREIIEDLPKSVEHIILKAMRKEQSQRYSSARVMESDMMRVLADSDVVLTDEDIDGFYSTRKIDIIDDSKINVEKKKTSSKKNKNKMVASIIAAGTVIILILLMVSGALFGKKEKLLAPNIKGLTVEEAEDAVQAIDSEITIIIEKTEYSTWEEKDKIISQEPDAGLDIPGTKEIYVIVGLGEEEFELRDFIGYQIEDAKEILESKGLLCKSVDETDEELNEQYDKGVVTRQEPSYDIIVKPGDSVKLYVSVGEEGLKPKVPSVKGLAEEQAKDKLNEAGFSNIIIISEESDMTKGTVISQSIAADMRVDANTEITLTLSSGKPERPDVGTITFTLPGNPDKMRVKVIRKDNGDTVYSMQHSAGETVSVNVMANNVLYEIYLDNKFWMEKSSKNR